MFTVHASENDGTEQGSYMTVERVVLVDPDPDCRVCDGTGQDFFIGPHTGHVYICECDCTIELHPYEYDRPS